MFPKPVKKVKKKTGLKKQSTIGKLKKVLEDLMKTLAKQRDGYICQKCGKRVEGINAHGSHVIPISASQFLRFDIQNLKCLCFHCHINWWHKHPLEAGRWFEEKFPDRYEYLQSQKLKMHTWTVPELLEMIQVYKRKVGEYNE